MSDLNFKNIESLDTVKSVVTDADKALSDITATIDTSSIPGVIGAALGAGIGGAGSFTALYFLGIVGLSGPGIVTGLATAGSIIGGGMVAGIGVLAAPVAILGVFGYAILARRKANKLKEAKESLLQLVIRKHDAIIRALKEEVNATAERTKYLTGLNILLQRAVHDLQADLSI